MTETWSRWPLAGSPRARTFQTPAQAGRKGGQSKSEDKQAAARRNGAKGGRPKGP